MTRYYRIKCACGRDFGSNVFKQHARKCLPMLREWKRAGNEVRLLDERSEERKRWEGPP